MGKNIELGKRIAWLRTGRGLEQKAAAEAMGIRDTTYQKYEYGNVPSWRKIDQILSFYQCNKAWLLTGEGMAYPNGGPEGITVGSLEPAPDRRQPRPATPAPAQYIKEGSTAWPAAGDAQKMNIDDAMGKAYKILHSGTPYAVALYLNIQQFSSALDATTELKVCQDRIADLQDQVDALRRQVEALTARPASSDLPAEPLEKAAM